MIADWQWAEKAVAVATENERMGAKECGKTGPEALASDGETSDRWVGSTQATALLHVHAQSACTHVPGDVASRCWTSR